MCIVKISRNRAARGSALLYYLLWSKSVCPHDGAFRPLPSLPLLGGGRPDSHGKPRLLTVGVWPGTAGVADIRRNNVENRWNVFLERVFGTCFWNEIKITRFRFRILGVLPAEN